MRGRGAADFLTRLWQTLTNKLLESITTASTVSARTALFAPLFLPPSDKYWACPWSARSSSALDDTRVACQGGQACSRRRQIADERRVGGFWWFHFSFLFTPRPISLLFPSFCSASGSHGEMHNTSKDYIYFRDWGAEVVPYVAAPSFISFPKDIKGKKELRLIAVGPTSSNSIRLIKRYIWKKSSVVPFPDCAWEGEIRIDCSAFILFCFLYLSILLLHQSARIYPGSPRLHWAYFRHTAVY